MDLSLIASMAHLMWIQSGISCVLLVDSLGFSITINDYFQAGLGLDSVRILRGFGGI